MDIRHGDMLLRKIEVLPEGLKKGGSNVLMTGSGGNDHTFVNGTFYPKQVNTFVFGYFESDKKCKLLHKDHGAKVRDRELKETKIPNGSIYELRKQQEDTHNGMKPVID